MGLLTQTCERCGTTINTRQASMKFGHYLCNLCAVEQAKIAAQYGKQMARTKWWKQR